MRIRFLTFFAIAFQIQILSGCGSDHASTPMGTDDPMSSGGDDDDDDSYVDSPADSPSSVSGDLLPVGAPLAHLDLTDPAAAATCGEIATRPVGSVTADAAFEVAGVRAVAGMFDAVNRLSLSFDWPSKRVDDGGYSWAVDARLSLALEVLDAKAENAFFVSGAPVPVRVWKYEKTERACTTVDIATKRAVSGTPVDGSATVSITKRTDTEIEGVVVLTDDKAAPSTLTFVAPLVPTLNEDTTVCCLGARGGK